jgi:hypothetical protein
MNQRDAESRVLKLLQEWRHEPLDSSSLGVQDQQQLQAVGRVLRGVAQSRVRRQRWRRVTAALAVAAAFVGLGLGGWVLSREPAQPEAHNPAATSAAPAALVLAETEGELQVLDGKGQPLARAARLGAGDGLETRAGAATLSFPSGARVRAASRTHLAIQSPGLERREALALDDGVVEVEVPKLPQPVEFSVQTPDARVVVHGTHFTVQVDLGSRTGTVTRVVVDRGLVEVLANGAQSWVRAGEQWPAPAEPAGVERAQGPVDGDPAELAPASPSARPSVRRPSRIAQRHATTSPRSLAIENRLLAAALAKHKAGDLSGALQDIDRLIDQYPDSLLMQEARVEHFRLLHRLGRSSEAAREARSYLGDYRDGYAREEARGLALEHP